MRRTSCLTWLIAALTAISSAGAQELDLNSLPDHSFRDDVNPITVILPSFMGSSLAAHHVMLERGEFRLTAAVVTTAPSSSMKKGPMEGADFMAMPLIMAEMGLVSGVELTGRFSASSLGSRDVVVTGYGLRYRLFNDEERNLAITSSASVSSLRGPEDFRVRNFTVVLNVSRSWGRRSAAVIIGSDFPETSVDAAAGGNLQTRQEHSLERTLAWAGLGLEQGMSDNLRLCVQWLQRKTDSRFSAGMHVRF